MIDSKVLEQLIVRGAKVRAISFAKTVLSWPGSDPAIQAILKNMRFLLLDGPIKSGHDISEFLGCPDFCSSYKAY